MNERWRVDHLESVSLWDVQIHLRTGFDLQWRIPSLPLPSEEEAVGTVSEALPGRLKQYHTANPEKGKPSRAGR